MRFLSGLKNIGRGVLSKLKSTGRQILSPIKNRLKPSELNSEEKVALLIATQSYEKQPTQTIPSVNGVFRLIPEMTTEYFKPYINDTTKQIFLGVRGTDLDINDLAEDALIIGQDLGRKNINFSRMSVRLSMLKDKISQLRNKYAGYSIVLIGHSLGGRLSKEISRTDSSIRAITFNSGGLDLFENIKDRRRENIQDITTGSDLISLGSLFNPRTKVVNPRGLGLGIKTHQLTAFS
jgi:hypothetical protein